LGEERGAAVATPNRKAFVKQPKVGLRSERGQFTNVRALRRGIRKGAACDRPLVPAGSGGQNVLDSGRGFRAWGLPSGHPFPTGALVRSST
jgi:hypothetical protein